MTNAEIVENARRILYGHDPYEAFSGVEIGQISAAIGVARILLRAQQEAEKNEPLTLIQINQHISGSPPSEIEPLYVVLILPTSTYALGWCTAYELTLLLALRKEEYGKRWLAYRRKPEEGNHV